MRCDRCGTVGQPGSRFCAACGGPVAPAAAPGASPPAVEEPRSGRSRWRVAALSVLAVAVAVAVGGAVAATNGPDRQAVVVTAESEPRPEAEPPREYSDEQLVREFGNAVFRIETDGCGFASTGSGFAIDERHVVTNWHVVSMDDTPIVHGRDGSTRNGRVIGATESPDIAVIELDKPVGLFLEWANTAKLTEGQHVLGLGYPVPGTDFSAAPGTIISFQNGPKGREAIRTDAALDRGNSGGPALTKNGEVAGVATEMADNQDGFQTVPLLFTHTALSDSVERMIKEKKGFTVDCEIASSLPQIPVGEIEMPEWESPDLPPLPAYEPPPPPTTLPCPTGSVVAEVHGVEASDTYGLGMWDVKVHGIIRNNTSAAISMPMLDVTFPGQSFPSTGFSDAHTIPPGGTGTWNMTTMVMDSRPTSATAKPSMYMWDDYNLSHCPTP
jgi:putative serine protease PepD